MKRQAFTLVELLVVIAIIGLLSTVAVMATNSSKTQARNARRIADIVQLQKAFNLAYDSAGGYPYSGAANAGTACISTACYGAWNLYVPYAPVNALLFPAYMGSVPTDPSDSLRNSGGYLYNSAWVGGNGLPAGTVLIYKLEGGVACGPGLLQVGNSTYSQCVLYLR